MQDILVETLMTDAVKCLNIDNPLRSAVGVMLNNHLSCVIITKNEIPTGIITERDLVKILYESATNNTLDQPVSSFMTDLIVTLQPDESLFDAVVISRAEKVRHLPVVENNKLIGIVTQTDLANAHFHVVEMQAEIIEQSIQDKTQELVEANEELLALSMEDHLLKIGNRRSMEVDLNHTHATAVRYNRCYSIVLVDVDYFKKYNDHYGHNKGDEALKSIADLLNNTVRESDRIYRYGGEELLLLLPDTDAENAQILSNKLVQALFDQKMPHAESPFQRLTISAGVSSAICDGQVHKHWEAVVQKADRCLYKSKKDGRNRSNFCPGYSTA